MCTTLLLVPLCIACPLFPPDVEGDGVASKLTVILQHDLVLDERQRRACKDMEQLHDMLLRPASRGDISMWRSLAAKHGIPRRRQNSQSGKTQERPVHELKEALRSVLETTVESLHVHVLDLIGSSSGSPAMAQGASVGSSSTCPIPGILQGSSLGCAAVRSASTDDVASSSVPQLVQAQNPTPAASTKQSNIADMFKRMSQRSASDFGKCERLPEPETYADRCFVSWWWLRDALRMQKQLQERQIPQTEELPMQLTVLLRQAQTLSTRDVAKEPWKTMLHQAELQDRFRGTGEHAARVRAPLMFLHYECTMCALRRCVTRYGTPVEAHAVESACPEISHNSPRNIQELAAMCKLAGSAPCVPPFGVDLLERHDLRPSASQFWWQLALVELSDRQYWQLPVGALSLLALIHTSRSSSVVQGEKPACEISDIVNILLKFVEKPGNAAAAQRFLSVQWTTRREELVRLVDRCSKNMKFHDVHLVDLPASTAATICAFLAGVSAKPSRKVSAYACVLHNTKRYIATSDEPKTGPLAMHVKLGCNDSSKQDVEGGIAILPPPVVCELCHQGFLHFAALASHCEKKHKGYPEYRKQILWKFQRAGPQALQLWLKRSMLQAYSFFEQFSIPSSGANFWSKALPKAKPRKEVACVVCAQKDWLEHRYECLLFQEPDGRISWSQVEDGCLANAESTSLQLTLCSKNGELCFGPSAKIDKILNVRQYMDLMPSIPPEELLYSSVAHPFDNDKKWLLHSRRVSLLPSSVCEAAGIGDPSKKSWLCKACLCCLCIPEPKMPPLALMNGLWLGRLHPAFANLSPACKMLLGRGRLVMKKLFLGKGDKEETQQGLAGNTILVAQASAENAAQLPCVQSVLDNLAIVFCKTLQDVKTSSFLFVNRQEYLSCAEIRKQVCPVFKDVQINRLAAEAELPTSGVPDAFVKHAVHMPETEQLQTVMAGPASRAGFASAHTEEDAESDEEGNVALEPSMQDSSSGQEMIGLDSGLDPEPAQLFNALTIKMGLVQEAAQKMVAQASKGPSDAPDCQVVADTESCRRLVIDVQDVMKKLSRTNKAVLDDIARPPSCKKGIAVTTGAPMSVFQSTTWPACFCEFFSVMQHLTCRDARSKFLCLTFSKLL